MDMSSTSAFMVQFALSCQHMPVQMCLFLCCIFLLFAGGPRKSDPSKVSQTLALTITCTVPFVQCNDLWFCTS